MSPEEKMARRLSELRGLTPPIDVLALARTLADTKVVNFPDWTSADGLTLNLKVPNKRPLILINKDSNELRQRFTLAHEIGHIVIPWHIGDILDELSAASENSHSKYRMLEAEANRFAAELLMPSEWTTRICTQAGNLRGALMTVAEVARVSLAAAALRVIQKGPSGHVVAYVADKKIEMIGQTIGTKASLPERGTEVDQCNLNAFARPEIYPKGRNAVYIWKELQRVAPPLRPNDNWRDILIRILSTFPPERRKKLQGRLNAIVGYQLGKHPKGSAVAVIYKDIVKAFENRMDYNDDVNSARNHPEFQNYLLARVYDRAEQ